jgi:8-oxo-dGTP diphosphatase
VRPNQRVAAYAIVRQGRRVLLARWVGPRGPQWSLPGGGLDHGEDPRHAAVREVREETGYDVRLDELLAIDSHRVVIEDAPEPLDHHGIRVIYRATIVGGDLRFEENGSSDMAAWFGLDEVADLFRVSLVDIGLAAAARPPGALE